MRDASLTIDLMDHTPDSPERNSTTISDRDLQRAHGFGRIVVSGSEQGTFITDIFQRSPVRMMFPRIGSSKAEEAVLINTAGGIAGGDCLDYSVTAFSNGSLRLTSQAAEKVYRALDAPAHISTKLKAHVGAKVAWLPQETIVFNRARLKRKTEIEVTSGAEVLALECLVLGRAAYGETVVNGHIIDTWMVRKDGRLIWADSLRVTSDIFPQLHRKALLSNFRAMATLIYFGPDLEMRRELMREIASSLQCQQAVTLVGEVLVVRFAAEFSCDLKLGLGNFLRQLGPQLGDGPFRVPKMWAC
jgi:urease accessory protein